MFACSLKNYKVDKYSNPTRFEMPFWKSKKKEDPSPSSHVHSPRQEVTPRYEAATPKSNQPGLNQIKNVIAIASGKGGVGKSTVSTNLALALQHLGAQVGLLDADIYGPSQPGMLGSGRGRAESNEAGQILPLRRHDVPFISMGLLTGDDAPVVWRAPMAIKAIQQFIGNVTWGSLDYLLIDLPPGTGDVQLTLSQNASLTGAVIVTTPQQVAIGVAKKGLKMFEQVRVPIIGVVENMSGFVCKQCGKEEAIFKEGGGEEMAKEMRVPYLGAIPLDPEIMACGDDGIPVVIKSINSPAAKAFLRLAEEFERQLEIVSGGEKGLQPTKVEVLPPGSDIEIEWSDGHKGKHRTYQLRANCPCAMCVDENSGRRVLDPKKIPLDISAKRIDKVGRYALTLQFSDGHSTGIYTYKNLRTLCECGECLKERGTFQETFSV